MKTPIIYDDDEPCFEVLFDHFGFGVTRHIDPNVSLWILNGPGFVLAWHPAISWWRFYPMRLLWWEFEP